MIAGQMIVTPVERQCSSGAHRKLHCKEAGLPWDLWCANCQRRFRKPADLLDQMFGEGYAQSIDEAHQRAVRMNREDHPHGCQLCGEQAGAEMGEFWLPKERHDEVKHYHRGDDEDTREEHSIITHAQCGLDHELEMA